MENKYIIMIAVLAVLLFIGLIVAIIRINKKKENKRISEETDRYGKLGEDKVDETLDSLDPKVYHVYKNVMFKTRDGMSHEIDDIIISKYGIYVIEVKNWSGKITGNESDDFWLKGDYHGVKKLKNPVKQNKVHVSCLKSALNLDESLFIPVVCFVKLDDEDSINTVSIVTSLNDLKKTLDKNKLSKPLSEKDVKEICNILETKVKKDNVSTKEHLKNIQKNH